MKTFRMLVALSVFMAPVLVLSTPAMSSAVDVGAVASVPTVASAAAVTDAAAATEAAGDVVSLFGLPISGSIGQFLMYVLSAIGAASVLVAGLKPLAKLTPTDKDDAWLAKAGAVLSKITDFLDKYVALNPGKSAARND